MLQIYRRKTNRKAPQKWFEKCLETTIKSAALLTYPAIPAVIVCAFWYYVLYKQDIHFNEGLKDIAIGAWITTFGILYALLAGSIVNTVWNEYKSIRLSIKCYDIDTFMSLRDEDVSPLVHVLMAVFSWSVLGAFMGLPYPDAPSGLITVGSTAYLFGLIFFVVMEIDNPLVGIWFIKNIHAEWMNLDVKEWRQGLYMKRRQEWIRETKGAPVELRTAAE